MQTVITINAVIMALFFVCYSYQFFYVAVALLKRKKFTCRNENHRIAVLIAARNEENVIGQLLDSIHAQKNYPMDHVDIYVGADNCTDDTARVARERGAIVFERHDTVHVGKGYVLNEMLKRIKRTGRKHYDAYLVLDADNILDPNFISEIEKVYSGGYEIVTCYRNSKNYGDNWISAGYALWFLREAQYLNNARMRLGSSCAVSGTGFLFSDGVLEACGGWNFFLLTEDIEFTIDNVVRGEKVGYAAGAVLYDEQHHARGGAHGCERGREHRRGDRERDVRRFDGGAGGLRAANADEPVLNALCARRDHDRDGVEEYPLRGVEKGALRLHVPALHAHLRADLHCVALYEGRVEADLPHQSDDA